MPPQVNPRVSKPPFEYRVQSRGGVGIITIGTSDRNGQVVGVAYAVLGQATKAASQAGAASIAAALLAVQHGATIVRVHDVAATRDAFAVLAAMDAHGMNPGAVLAMVGDLGGQVGQVLVVGCEAACLDHGIGLSAPVTAALPAAVEAVRELIDTLVKEGTP